MKTKHALCAVGILLLSLIAVVGQTNPNGNRLPRHVEGELLVRFAGGPRGAAAVRTKSAMKHEVKRHFDFIGWQQIRLPRGMTVKEGLAHYGNLPGVAAVEPNSVLDTFAPVPNPAGKNLPLGEGGAIPNDPMFNQQYALARIGATNAWAVTTGSTNVVVAIIDTGINYNHEDLAANMWRNPGEIPGNSIDDDGNGYIDDVHGIDSAGNDSDPMDQGVFLPQLFYHGTACAGVAGAVANNGLGIAGVNRRGWLMALRSIGMNQHLVGDFLEAFNFMLLMKSRGVDIRVVSMSWGGTNSFGGAAFLQAVRDAHQAAANAGIVQVTACGNSAADNDLIPNYPRAFNLPGMIDVAASDQNDLLWSLSNYGRTNVDLAAPGVGITMTYAPATNSYTSASGTSFAGPLVAGAAALLFAANPGATAEDVKAALLESVDLLPAFTNKMVSNGRLNVARAMYHPAIRSNLPPVIASQPQSRIANEGASTNFSVIAYGARPLAYQWHKQGQALANHTNAALSLTNLTPADTGDYALVVTNAFGALTSAVASLTVRAFPRSVAPLSPLQLSAVPGELVTLSVETTGTLPIGYRWRHIRTNGTSANLTTLVLTQHICFVTLPAGTNSAGAYTVILTNAAQPTSSIQRTNAVLTLLADSDGDGLPDAWETAFSNATNAAVDTDLDGLTNLQEYQAGTDPTNSLSYLRVENIARDAGSDVVSLRFTAVASKTYKVQQRATADTGAWSRLVDVLASPTNRLVEIIDTKGPPANSQRFYRLATPRDP